MPHRDDPWGTPSLDRPDPFDHFVELWSALMEHRRLTSDLTAFRFAALVLTPSRGDAPSLVEQSLAGMKTAKATAPNWNTVVPPVALLLSAAMVKRGDDPAVLWPTIEHTRDLFRAEGLPRNQAHEGVAAWTFRALRSELASKDDVARLASLFRDMKRRHWWTTNAMDYPLCAFLAAQSGSIDEIAERVEGTYQSLRSRAGFNRGNALQTTAMILAGAGLEPELAGERAAALVAALSERGERTRPFRYDELAMMCFISLPVDQVADQIVRDYERIRGLRNSFLDSVWLFPIAVSLCFLRTLGHDAALETLSDLKAVLDLLAILAARQ